MGLASMRSILRHIPCENRFYLLFPPTKITKVGAGANPVDGNALTKNNGKVSDPEY